MNRTILIFSVFLFNFIYACEVVAIDCNACNYDCGSLNIECYAKKRACREVANTLDSNFLTYVNDFCANYPGRMDEREKIGEAINILVSTGLLMRNELDGVQIRWCKIRGNFGSYSFGASGMVPEQNKILLDVDHKGDSAIILASLIGHEMQHIRQYRYWGTSGFRCRYMVNIAAGNGFECNNKVEKDAYNFEQRICMALNLSGCNDCGGAVPEQPSPRPDPDISRWFIPILESLLY